VTVHENTGRGSYTLAGDAAGFVIVTVGRAVRVNDAASDQADHRLVASLTRTRQNNVAPTATSDVSVCIGNDESTTPESNAGEVHELLLFVCT
jgi:hypothetical protein